MNEHKRISWISRITIKPAERDELREISKEIRIPVSKLIGTAITDFLSMRST
jgi:hypothetical protein